MNKLAKYIIATAVGLLIAFIAWYFSNILIYIIISALLSLVGKPLMDRLSSIRIKGIAFPKTIAALVTISVIILVIFGVISFIVPLIGTLASNINGLELVNVGDQISKPLEGLNFRIHVWFPALDPNFKIENALLLQIQNLINSSFITQFFTSITTFLINFAIGIFVVIFITFFFLKEQNMFNNMVKALFPDKFEENVDRALNSISNLLVRYFIGISVETVAITILNGFGLYLFAGVDFSLAFILAFLSGVLNVIPYIGPITGGLFGVLMSMVAYGFDTPGLENLIIITASVFITTHIIDVFVFQPFIYSNSVKAHPLEIFLVILVAGSIAGIVGMLIAIPTYTVIRVFAREFFSHLKLVQKLTVNIK